MRGVMFHAPTDQGLRVVHGELYFCSRDQLMLRMLDRGGRALCGVDLLEAARRPGCWRLRLRSSSVVIAAVLSACRLVGVESDDSNVSTFVEDTVSSVRVLDNVTACEVDAVCYLRLEFADTTINALYGTGERPRTRCDVPRAVSNVAFGVERGDIVQVIVSKCGEQGHYLRQIGRD